MSIRTRCALLILAFEITLCVTLTLTVRLIGRYFDDAADDFTEASALVADISRLRTLARNQQTLLRQSAEFPAAGVECGRLALEIDETRRTLDRRLNRPDDADDRRVLELAVGRHQAAVAEYLSDARAAPASSATDGTPADIAREQVNAARATLDDVLRDLLAAARTRVDQPFTAQRKAAMILSINAIVGVLLGILGLLLVRRWVLEPIQELAGTADELGRGNLECRARVRSGDEFGQLAATFNRMSADLARLERQMIQRERMAAMGELIAYVAHNIRNPLAGIQAAADAARRNLDPESPVRAHQEAIVGAIERFQVWLRQLERVCAPMELQAANTDIAELVRNTVSVFRPTCERRSIRVDLHAAGPYSVRVDPRYFEQALAAVLGNAIEASADGQQVQVRVEPDADPGHWVLRVADQGPGIPADVIDRIFEPTFSTKKSGHGLGLAMVRRIVELHGGEVWAECPPPRGAVVTMRMPR